MPTEEKTTQKETIVREVDRKTQSRLRALELKAETAKYRAAIKKAHNEAKSIERSERFAARMRLATIRAGQSASEKARTNLALTTPAILVLLIGGFILLLGTGAVPDESVSVASALLTLLVTGLMANLRSIISEGQATDTNGNGHDDDTKPKPKPKPKKEE